MPTWIKNIQKEVNIASCLCVTAILNTIAYCWALKCSGDALTHISFVSGVVSMICAIIIVMLSWRVNSKIKAKLAIINLKQRYEDLQRKPMLGGSLTETESQCLEDDLKTAQALHGSFDEAVKTKITETLELIKNRDKNPLFYEIVCNKLKWITDINTII